MADAEFEYGKIFVNASTTTTHEFVTSILGESGERALWVTQGVEVEVRHNPDERGADDFIGWPTFVEIAPQSTETRNEDVTTVARDLVAQLRAWCGGAILAADYEDEI